MRDMKSSYELKTDARMALKGNWTMPVLTNFVMGVLSCSTLITIFVGNPVMVGLKNSLRNLLHKKNGDDVFTESFNLAFAPDYIHKVATMLLKAIYIFLWSLLLIIPGIIKHYSYAMTEFILLDNPELDADSAIHKSRMLMQNHKWDLFCLDLSFIGWFILCILTCGIGFLWLSPYVKMTHAAFYDQLVNYTAETEGQPEEQ